MCQVSLEEEFSSFYNCFGRRTTEQCPFFAKLIILIGAQKKYGRGNLAPKTESRIYVIHMHISDPFVKRFVAGRDLYDCEKVKNVRRRL